MTALTIMSYITHSVVNRYTYASLCNLHVGNLISKAMFLWQVCAFCPQINIPDKKLQKRQGQCRDSATPYNWLFHVDILQSDSFKMLPPLSKHRG